MVCDIVNNITRYCKQYQHSSNKPELSTQVQQPGPDVTSTDVEMNVESGGVPSEVNTESNVDESTKPSTSGVNEPYDAVTILLNLPEADLKLLCSLLATERWWTDETIAVVTGGNRGIGFEMTRQPADHGLTVVLTSRDENVGIEAVKVLQEAGLKVEFHQLDIVDPASIQEFAEWIQETHGGMDILVNYVLTENHGRSCSVNQINNAGVNFNVGSDNSIEHAEQVIRTNYYGTKDVIKAVLPIMKPSSFE